MMRRVKSKDTKPELLVRKILHGLGYRYRLHRKDLPGKPDIVFISKRKVIFIHGCFWHQHPKCKAASIPKSNTEFWSTKLDGNVKRDNKHLKTLEHDGWNVLTIWECEIKDKEKLIKKLKQFLEFVSGHSNIPSSKY